MIRMKEEKSKKSLSNRVRGWTLRKRMSKNKFPTLDREGKCKNKDMYFSVLSSSSLHCATLLLM